jgi:sulfur transfer complex TusBCD TusB component (DsrH family)
MAAYRPISSVVFELLCVQAEAGRPINLVAAGVHATFDQARTLAVLMKRPGTLSLRKEDYDHRETAELRLTGCQWITEATAGKPETSPPDNRQIW